MKDLFASENPEDAGADADPAKLSPDFEVVSPTDHEVIAANSFFSKPYPLDDDDDDDDDDGCGGDDDDADDYDDDAAECEP